MPRPPSPFACCAPLSSEPLPRPVAERLATSFKAVSDPARLRLLSLILSRPDAEACVCELTSPLGLSQPTVTHHLQVLHRAGLVEREKRGVWAYYRVVRPALDALRRALG